MIHSYWFCSWCGKQHPADVKTCPVLDEDQKFRMFVKRIYKKFKPKKEEYIKINS